MINKVLLRRVHPIFAAIHSDQPIPCDDLQWVNEHFRLGVSTEQGRKQERCVPAYLRPLYTVALGLEDDYDEVHFSTLQFVHRRLCGNFQDMQVVFVFPPTSTYVLRCLQLFVFRSLKWRKRYALVINKVATSNS